MGSGPGLGWPALREADAKVQTKTLLSRAEILVLVAREDAQGRRIAP